jgi:hypothetical protein
MLAPYKFQARSCHAPIVQGVRSIIICADNYQKL